MPERPILIIDDDPAIRATVAEILTSEGYSVATAVNGADGLQSLDRLDPALVRPDDPPRIVGDASALRARTGWQPTWDLAATLASVFGDQERTRPSN